MTPEIAATIELEVLGEIWRRGGNGLRHLLLDDDQLEQSAALWSSTAPGDEFHGCISRRRGKSYWAVVECVALCAGERNTLVKYASLTQKSVRAIIEPLMIEVLASCPEDLRPTYDAQRAVWSWANGSSLSAFGVDSQHYKAGRGPASHFNVWDEAGFFPESDWQPIASVLDPMLLTTHGRTLMVTTPPESSGHPYRMRYLTALARGRAMHRTIWGHPRLTEDQINGFLTQQAEARGMTLAEFKATTYYRREFLAEFVTEETRAAVPGWNQEAASVIVAEHARPTHFHGYEGLDWGFGDPHGATFGYLDFERGLLIIEDELELRNVNTAMLAAEVKAKEAHLWGVTGWDGTLAGAGVFEAAAKMLPEFLRASLAKAQSTQPFLRVGDNDNLVLADLMQLHGLAVMPTRKDDKQLAVDALDVLVRQRRLRIHPRCKRLIHQLYTTVWNKSRTGWERNSEGHGDVLDALIYMVRNVFWNNDPRPAVVDSFWSNEPSRRNVELARAFGAVRRRA